MHGNWDDVSGTWDSWSDEYRWDFNSYEHSGSFTFQSGLGVSKDNVNRDLQESFSLRAGMKGVPAGSTYHVATSLKMRTRLQGLISVMGFELHTFSAGTGLPIPKDNVIFSNAISLGSKAGVSFTGGVVIPTNAGFTMGTDLFGGSGNLYFESLTFKVSSSIKSQASFDMNLVESFGLSASLRGTEIVDFEFGFEFAMGISYTVKDGWWIRPSESSSNLWEASVELKNDWSAESPEPGTGWEEDKF